VHWLADKGCRIFGVEAVSPAPEGEFSVENAIHILVRIDLFVVPVSLIEWLRISLTARAGELNFKAHNICGERGITHMEGLDNLHEVVDKGRFTFIGFPLKLKGCSGSPIRAVAMLNQE